MTMRAVAITDDRGLAAVDLERPTPAAGEVLVQVGFCGICGSDLHMLDMPAELVPSGHVLGHEFTGAVVAVASDVDGWDVGERVTILPMVACGHCYACRSGHANLCETGISHGPGLGRPGAYAEFVAVPAGMLHRLPDSVSDAHGALTEPLAVAIRGIELSGAAPDEPICVLGAGPIGVMTLVALRARGFQRVVVVEPNAGRRQIVAELGGMAVAPGDALAQVPGVLGDPPSVVIDCTGHPSGAPLAIDLLPAAGRLTIVGIPNDPVALSLGAIAMKELVIRGSLAYSTQDFAEAIDHIAAGRVPCDEIITTVARVDAAPEWFADLKGGATEQVKVLLRP
jgi:(R,R)-butanediol dehydrogenase/meso-butanediol dehydrogenase/diacetyl reductase